MKILHVTQPHTHGTARCVAALAAYQHSMGIEVIVAAPSSDFLRELGAAGVATRSWPADRSFNHHSWREATALRRLILDVDPDVVHLHSSKGSILGRVVIRGNRPTIVHPHAWSFYALPPALAGLGRRVERFLSRWSDAVFCTGSAELLDGAAAELRGRMYNVGNGVDTDSFAPSCDSARNAVRAELGIRPEQRVAVIVGRLCEQKGQLPFIEAWKCSARHPDDVLVLVGDGPDESAARRSSGDDLLVLGWRDDVADMLAMADVYVQPSRWEGLAIGLLEAMAYDLPIVASAAGSTIDALGDLGSIHPIGDDRALVASTLSALAGDRPPPGETRARVIERFSLAGWTDAVTTSTLNVGSHR